MPAPAHLRDGSPGSDGRARNLPRRAEASAPPGVRAGTLHGYSTLTRSLGLDPTDLLARVGLRPAHLADPDGWLRAATVARLLDITAAASGHEDFGLLLAEQRRLSTFGRLSVVLREEPDLRSALSLLVRYEHSVNEVVRLDFIENHSLATVRTWLEFGEPVPLRQALELTLGALVGFIRSTRRPGWEPLAVCLAHPAPSRPTRHRSLLGPTVRFGQEFTGLVLAARDLDSANALADPEDRQLRASTRQFLRTFPDLRNRELVARVRELVQALLPVGRGTMSEVARAMGTTPRTLHRHLAAGGDTFEMIVDGTRASLAERFLATHSYSLTDISYLLGFAAPSAFSRWFRRRFGCSPTEWRARAV